jgi:hypothetical protein
MRSQKSEQAEQAMALKKQRQEAALEAKNA